MTDNDEFRSLTKNETYYIAGADLCLLVENVHFRVHRYFFERESARFTRMLGTPASPGQQPQGTQDSNAIVLEGLTAKNFATFLWVFYNPLYSLYEAGISDLTVILELAVRWEFPEVKNLAIRELEKKEMPLSKRIKLYHANYVDRNILIPYYAALCEREAHLTLEEGEDIGMETVLMIAAGRQEVRAQPLASGGRTPMSPTYHGLELHNVVREIFKIPEEDKTGNTSGTSPVDKKINGTNGTNTDFTADLPNQKGKRNRGGGK
jgi:hypothetical protein